MRRALSPLKKYALWIVIGLVFVFIQTLAELFLPSLMSEIVDVGIAQGDTDFIIRTSVIMLIVAFGGTIAAIASGYLSARVGTGFARDLRGEVFHKVADYSSKEMNKVGVASLITRSTNDVSQLQTFVVMVLRIFVRAPFMAIGGIIMMVGKDPTLSLILVVVVPLLALIISIVAKKSMPLFKSIQTKVDGINQILREQLSGIRVIRAFNKAPVEKKRFKKANHDLTEISIKVNRIMSLMMPLLMLVLNLTTIAILWFGSIRIDNGFMQVGDMMAFIQYAMQILYSILMLTMIFILFPRASVSADRIKEVLEVQPSIGDNVESNVAFKQHGNIVFDKVSFYYDEDSNPALNDISFEAKKGEVTAIIGGTGSGKTTIANLMLRFFEANQGKILLNGVDITQMPRKQLRDSIGYVSQKAAIFSGSIKDNLKFQDEDASDEEIWEACKTAQAEEFIREKEDQLDAEVAQDGTNLSGGQKQRISIARSLVKPRDVYVFDDCFSALDFKTDAKLREALKEKVKESTVIMVAQRVATVMDADQIIVLNDGEVAGIGTHESLLSANKVYQEICHSQLSQEELR